VPAAGKFPDHEEAPHLSRSETMLAGGRPEIARLPFHDAAFRQQRPDPSQITALPDQGSQQARLVRRSHRLSYYYISV
jgi:hypothetical protein